MAFLLCGDVAQSWRRLAWGPSLRQWLVVGLALLATLLASGCANPGSRAIQISRTNYNEALRQTDDEQLLLNLVRLRYRDRPLFLEASALNTQFTFGGTLAAGVEIGDGSDTASIGGGYLVEEKPTVTYTLLQGEGFVQRVLSNISLDTLFLLDGSGWSAERVWRICVQQMNGLRNAPRASGPTPANAPEYREFLRAAKLLRVLDLRDVFSGARRDETTSVIRFTSAAESIPEFHQFMDMVDLDTQRRTFVITTALERGTREVLNIKTRSFAGVMYFLSQAVDVPQRDIDAGRVTVTRDAAGDVFDWLDVTDGLMRVHTSDEPPQNAAVAIAHRGAWFYIDDSDLDSKSTFSMLGQIYSLQAGDVKGLTPVLTIPVGG